MFSSILGKERTIATTYQYSGLFIHFYKNRCIDFLRHKIVQKEVENKMQEEYRLTLQMKYYSLGELDEGIFEKMM